MATDRQRAYLESANKELCSALESANDACRAVWPAGAKVIVRTQRYGYPPKDHAGEVVGSRVEVTPGFGRGACVHVYVRVRNTKTGKISMRYPGLLVEGVPQVRHEGDNPCI